MDDTAEVVINAVMVHLTEGAIQMHTAILDEYFQCPIANPALCLNSEQLFDHVFRNMQVGNTIKYVDTLAKECFFVPTREILDAIQTSRAEMVIALRPAVDWCYQQMRESQKKGNLQTATTSPP